MQFLFEAAAHALSLDEADPPNKQAHQAAVPENPITVGEHSHYLTDQLRQISKMMRSHYLTRIYEKMQRRSSNSTCIEKALAPQNKGKAIRI